MDDEFEVRLPYWRYKDLRKSEFYFYVIEANDVRDWKTFLAFLAVTIAKWKQRYRERVKDYCAAKNIDFDEFYNSIAADEIIAVETFFKVKKDGKEEW